MLRKRAIFTRFRFRLLIFRHTVPAPVPTLIPYKIWRKILKEVFVIIFLLKLDGNRLIFTWNVLLLWFLLIIIYQAWFRFQLLIFPHTVPVPALIPYKILRKILKKVFVIIFLLKLDGNRLILTWNVLLLIPFNTNMSNPYLGPFLYLETEPEPEPKPRERSRFRFWSRQNDTIRLRRYLFRSRLRLRNIFFCQGTVNWNTGAGQLWTSLARLSCSKKEKNMFRWCDKLQIYRYLLESLSAIPNISQHYPFPIY